MYSHDHTRLMDELYRQQLQAARADPYFQRPYTQGPGLGVLASASPPAAQAQATVDKAGVAVRIKIPRPPFHVDWCDAVYDTEMREFCLFSKRYGEAARTFSVSDLLALLGRSHNRQEGMEVRWLLQNCGEAAIAPSQATKFTTKSAKLLLL